jgi:hypothetical protein
MIEGPDLKTTFDLQFTHCARVVKILQLRSDFFRTRRAENNFSKVETFRAKEFEGTYYSFFRADYAETVESSIARELESSRLFLVWLNNSFAFLSPSATASAPANHR